MLARTSYPVVVSVIMVAVLFILPPAAMAATYTVPGDFATITDAIANASGGDTITVGSGTYSEHIIIDKGLTLLGRDTGADRPTIDALGVEVSADNAIVQGFRVRGAATGIDAHGCSNAKIMDCVLVNNKYGIKLTGVRGGIVMNNTVTGSQNTGIYLADSSGNSIYMNVVTGNQYGIALTGSSSTNSVYMNTLEDNSGANGLANGAWNSWNSSIPFTYGYGGRQFSKSLGNYWGGLNAADNDNDGILDTTVMLAENNGDYSPLADAPPDRPEANFTSDSTSGTAPLPVQFTDASRGYPVSWHWDFGDGTTSDVQNPPHIYNSAGAYTVTLKVASAHGEDTLVRSNYIVAGTAPSATSTATPVQSPTPEPWPTATVKASATPMPTWTPAPRSGGALGLPMTGMEWLAAIAALAAACALTGRRGSRG